MHSDPATVIKHRKVIAEELAQARKSNGTVTMSDLKSSLYGATIEGGWPKPIVLGHDPTEEVRLALDPQRDLTGRRTCSPITAQGIRLNMAKCND